MSIADSNNTFSASNISEGSVDLVSIFLNFCRLIFNYRSDIKSPRNVVDPQQINRELSDIIRTYMEQDQTAIINRSLKEIIYLMIAMADEIFLNTEWEGKRYWEENMLEKSFWGTQVAGELIYKKTDDLLLHGETFSLEKLDFLLSFFPPELLGSNPNLIRPAKILDSSSVNFPLK